MTTGQRIAIAAGALLIAVGVGRAWLAEHDARNQAESIQKANDATAKKAAELVAAEQKTIEDLHRQLIQIQTDQSRQLSNLAAVFAAAKTPQQIADTTTKVVALPVPAQVTPAGGVDISAPDLPKFKDYLAQCEACKVNLAAADKQAAINQRTIEAQKAQLEAEKQISGSLTAERDAWKKAARGTFWSRTASALKSGAIGGGIALAATCGSGHCK